jgi:flagellar motor switch protein FliN/FliY
MADKPMAANETQSMEMRSDEYGGLDLLGDVDLHVKVELGRTQMLVEDVLRLSDGAVVELDKLAGDPVDVYVNNRLVARGEVLVLNDNFCIRISEIVADLEKHAKAMAQGTGADETDDLM